MKLTSLKKLIIIVLLTFLIGTGSGFYFDNFIIKISQPVIADPLNLDEQEATIRAIKKVMPAVVSVVVYDQEDFIAFDVPSGKQEIQKYKKKKGSGSGFLISSDGLILTNKHVINSGERDTSDYQVILNSGKQYYAQFIGEDKLKDLAVLKIFDKDLPFVELGNSDDLTIGTTVIAIGNALGRYQNSVTKGIISGMNRSLDVIDNEGNAETLYDVIQTDAEINIGNSGGPLIDLTGKLVGVNTAIDTAGTSIGFAIPINDVRNVITSVKQYGLIIRPRLGVRYVMITPEIAREYNLPRDSGALLIESSDGSPAVLPDSPSAEAGLAKDDIIFEINAIKIEGSNTLFSVIQRYKAGDKIGLKVQRGDEVIIKIVTLDKY